MQVGYASHQTASAQYIAPCRPPCLPPCRPSCQAPCQPMFCFYLFWSATLLATLPPPCQPPSQPPQCRLDALWGLSLACLKIVKYQIVEIIGIGWTGDDAGATQASSTTWVSLVAGSLSLCPPPIQRSSLSCFVLRLHCNLLTDAKTWETSPPMSSFIIYMECKSRNLQFFGCNYNLLSSYWELNFSITGLD